MSESDETKRRHPSPARRETGVLGKRTSQSDGRNLKIAGAPEAKTPDVLEEAKRTASGYPEAITRPSGLTKSTGRKAPGSR